MDKLIELKIKMDFAKQHGNLEIFYELEKEYLREVKKCKN